VSGEVVEVVKVVMALVAGTAAAQQAEPLRKSDLVRLLAGGAVSKAEIANLVRRSCLTFTPSARDRADLEALGADSAIMLRIDECVRRAATPAPPVVRPAPRRSPSLPVSPRPSPSPPVPRVLSPERTAFVSGGGQRGRVGTELPLPVVFEVRDTANVPLAGQEVSFSGSNARVAPERAVTDSTGQIRVKVVLGPRALAATVRARIAAWERQVSMLAVPGPPERVVVRCGANAVQGRVVVRAGAAARLEVAVHDTYGNELPVTGLRAVVGDERSLRVTGVSGEGSRGILTIDARRAGSTSLAVFASGLRAGVTIAVSETGPAGCSLDSPPRPS
jgi:hypothetical protein